MELTGALDCLYESGNTAEIVQEFAGEIPYDDTASRSEDIYAISSQYFHAARNRRHQKNQPGLE
jgi:hypothetical protein